GPVQEVVRPPDRPAGLVLADDDRVDRIAPPPNEVPVERLVDPMGEPGRRGPQAEPGRGDPKPPMGHPPEVVELVESAGLRLLRFELFPRVRGYGQGACTQFADGMHFFGAVSVHPQPDTTK